MQLEPAPSHPPAWGAHNVHLWWHATPATEAAPRARRARLDRLLRRVLARYLDAPPATLRFGREARGRPYLLDGGPDFNLSDTDGGTLLAVAQQPRIGVDLECLARVPAHRRLARRYFDPDECTALEALDDEAARVAFLQLWTAKEASCKSTGTGIYGQLHRWGFAVDSAAPQLRRLPEEVAPATRWQHLRLMPWQGYTAVLACDGFTPQPRAFLLAD